MNNFTLGRFLSIIIPGGIVFFIIQHVSNILNISRNYILYNNTIGNSDSTLSVFWFMLIVVLLGTMIDNGRHWFVPNIFISKANFYGLFKFWHKLAYIKHVYKCKSHNEIADEYQCFEYHYKRYQEQYRQCYKYWLDMKIQRTPHVLDIAEQNKLHHVLYNLCQTPRRIIGPNKQYVDQWITITNGQIWPIFATKHKDAFKFYQDYFLVELSLNIMFVLFLGMITMLLIIPLIYIHNDLYYPQLYLTLLIMLLYILFAKVSCWQILSQLRFFRLLILYDAIGSLDNSIANIQEAIINVQETSSNHLKSKQK